MDPVRQLVQARPGFDQMQSPLDCEQALKINDFIYLSPGTSNAYMVLTAAGRVIINTGMGWEARRHKQLFDAVCPGPTRYIIATQGHVDHLGGVDHFREPDTQFIAQANNAACQRDDQRIATVRTSQAYIWFQRTLDTAAKVAAEHPEYFIQDQPVADIAVDDSHRFALGGLEFALYHVPGGETVDSLVVHLPQHGIVFSGNTFGPLFPHFPNFNTIRGDRYRFAEPYLAAVARVRALAPELLITGHFEPVAGAELIDACLARLAQAVDYVHRETLAGMNAGEDIDSLVRRIQLPEELYVGQGYGKVSWAVRTFWESYMGWFTARSTTELYPTRWHELGADLLELCGAEALLMRGRARLDGNDPEKALYFAELVLAAEPAHAHAGALRLSLEAHRALRARMSEPNFWEGGWLDQQIRQLQAALLAQEVTE